MPEYIEVEVVTDTKAAKILAIGVQTLRNSRHLGKGPPYIKMGRSVRYKVADLLNWMDKNRIDPENS